MNQPRQILTPGEVPAAVETKTYDDGTVVTGPGPLPEQSPAQQDKVRGKPGPKPKPKAEPLSGAAPAADDLAEFDSDELPAAPEGAADFSPAQQALIAKMVADAVRASRSSQDPGTAAKLAAQANATATLPTQEAARAICEDAVAKGQRPRAVLTTQGWYVHPEMARTKDTGIANLGG